MSSKTLGQKGGILQTEVTYFEASEAKTKGEERTLGQGLRGHHLLPLIPSQTHPGLMPLHLQYWLPASCAINITAHV